MGSKCQGKEYIRYDEMSCLRSMLGVTIMDRIENGEIRRRVGVQIKLLNRVEKYGLRCSGHVDRKGKGDNGKKDI